MLPSDITCVIPSLKDKAIAIFSPPLTISKFTSPLGPVIEISYSSFKTRLE